MKYRQHLREVQIPQVICTPEERTQAAEILAACVDKPVKRITHSSQLPGWKEPVRVEEETLKKKASRKEEQILAYLKAHPSGVPTTELNDILGSGREAARHTLESMESRGIIHSRLAVAPRSNGVKIIRLWGIV